MTKHRFLTTTRRILPLVIAMSINVIAFQNCSGGFVPSSASSIDTGEGLAAPAPVVYTSPTLVVANPPGQLSNMRDQALNLDLKVDPRLSVKSVSCSLDAEPPRDCAGLVFELKQLTDGDHVVAITAEDSNDQRTPEIRLMFRIDATAPVVSFSQMPPSVTGSATSTAFSAVDALSGVTSVECSLDTAAFAACTSPMAFTSLAMGAHTFKVRAKDAAGNSSPDSVASWMVDVSAPVLTLSAKPNALSNSKSASFSFSGKIGTTNITEFQCSLDNGTFATCTSPVNFMNLGDGAHSFRVQGRDNNGVYSSPLAYSWTVDTVVPSTPLLTASVGTITNLTAVSVSFMSTDATSSIASFQCSTSNGTFATCTSPWKTTNLIDGTYNLRVKALDGAGNESQIGMFTWKVDATLPVITFTAKPLTMTTDTSATYSFTATDAGSGVAKVECQIDTQAYAACTSPRTFTGLTTGLHAFRVRCTDMAGNAKIAEDAWTIEAGTPQPVDGRMIYANNCASCHSPIDSSTKKGRSIAQIMNAIANVSSMASLKSLKGTEIDAVAAALAPPPIQTVTAAAAADKYFAQPTTAKDSKRTFRLTLEQLERTVSSLFGTLALPSIKTALPQDPLVGNYEYAENLTINSASFPGFSSWVDQVVTIVKANPRSAVDCMSTNNSPTCLGDQARLFVTKAFRGDVDAAKVTELVNFYLTSVTTYGYPDATANFVDVVLSSPQFLFREEFETTTTSVLVATEQLQLLTYVLADVPAEKLALSSANAATYVQATTKANSVNTILASADARSKLSRFILAWLEVKDPTQFTISQTVYPDFTPQIAQSAVNETKKFLSLHLSKAQPSLKDITRATQSYVDSNLAGLYGQTTPDATGNTLVTLNANERLGIFSQASVIASHSGPDSSRLVKRGAFFARKVMCIPIAGAPPGTNTTLPTSTNLVTQRQKVEFATNSTNCMGCHATMNPLGFFQENFSASGKWRTLDAGQAIDASITFTSLDEGPFNAIGPVETLTELTDSVMFKQCFVRQMFRYYMGRNETPSDDPVMKEMFLAFMQNDSEDILAALKVLANSNRLMQR